MSSFNVKDARERVAFNPAHLDDYGLDVYEFRVYMRLVRRAGGFGGQTQESVSNLAMAVRFCETKVRRALKVLLELRMIRLEADFYDAPKCYTLLSDKDWVPADQCARLKALALTGEGVVKTNKRKTGRRKRASIIGRLRREIYMRDNGQCRYCRTSEGDLVFDHVTPFSRGGVDTADNLVLACGPCNQQKRDRTPEEAGMVLLSVPESVGKEDKHSSGVFTEVAL